MSEKADLKVVELKTNWAGKIDPHEILKGAIEDGEIEDVLIIAYTKGGGLQAHSSISEVAETILMVERFKHAMLNGQYETF